MKIYIDESGPFAIPAIKTWAVSCIGAIAVKDSDHDHLLNCYSSLKQKWGIHQGEVKGSTLNESQTSDLISAISDFDILFDLCAIDMAQHTAEDLFQHKRRQALGLIRELDLIFHPNGLRDWFNLYNSINKMSVQLYAQGMCGWQLIASILQKITFYFAQKSPSELGSFSWVFDAKDKIVTPYETTWKSLALPFLESISINSPMIFINDFGYSHFDRFTMLQENTPERLREAIGESTPFRAVNIKAVFGDCHEFKQSHDSIGLQIIDNLTTIARRAMNGNLQQSGWAGIGNIMVQDPRQSQPFQMIDLSPMGSKYRSKLKPPYLNVTNRVTKTCKHILCD